MQADRLTAHVAVTGQGKKGCAFSNLKAETSKFYIYVTSYPQLPVYVGLLYLVGFIPVGCNSVTNMR